MHYVSGGADDGEFVELAHEMAENVDQCYLVLYNGNTGRTYGSELHVGTDGIRGDNEHDHVGGLSFVYFDIDNLRGSASGNGMALVDGRNGAVLQFISYDGTFTAQNGPAAGMQSFDIGVSERGGNPGGSLQLTGSGCQFDHFSFEKTTVATKGHRNTNQAGTCFLNANTISPSSSPVAGSVLLRSGLRLSPQRTPTLSGSPTPMPSAVPSDKPSSRPSFVARLFFGWESTQSSGYGHRNYLRGGQRRGA